MNNELSYLVYLLVSLAMTIWVARTLSRNGEIFLVHCFGQDERLAKSTNHLLVVGFYLINIGFIALRMERWAQDLSPGQMIPYLAGRIGLVVLVLGGMHFFNMMLIARYGATVSSWVRTTEWRNVELRAAGSSTAGLPPR